MDVSRSSDVNISLHFCKSQFQELSTFCFYHRFPWAPSRKHQQPTISLRIYHVALFTSHPKMYVQMKVLSQAVLNVHQRYFKSHQQDEGKKDPYFHQLWKAFCAQALSSFGRSRWIYSSLCAHYYLEELDQYHPSFSVRLQGFSKMTWFRKWQLRKWLLFYCYF